MPTSPESYNNENVSIASLGFDALGWATYRNPFFTTRLGTSGWDPSTRPWMSKLNRLLAPRAAGGYSKIQRIAALSNEASYQATDVRILTDAHRAQTERMAYARAGRTNRRLRRAGLRADRRVVDQVGDIAYGTSGARGQRARIAERLRAGSGGVGGEGQIRASIATASRRAERTNRRATSLARRMGFDSLDEGVRVAGAAEPRGVADFFVRVTGERTMNAREAHLARQARTRFGDFKWVSDLFGRNSSASGLRHAAGAYGLGRVLTSANVAMLAYDFTKLALKPFEALAEVGVNARSAPVLSTGAGLREPGAAATIRQSAIAQMQASNFAPRSIIGQEANFLHV